MKKRKEKRERKENQFWAESPHTSPKKKENTETNQMTLHNYDYSHQN
jgi:hypothetical protein